MNKYTPYELSCRKYLQTKHDKSQKTKHILFLLPYRFSTIQTQYLHRVCSKIRQINDFLHPSRTLGGRSDVPESASPEKTPPHPTVQRK